MCFHLDNHAAFSNIILNDDVYPPGFHDYGGGEYVDGCTGFAQRPAQGQVRLTRGDKRPHFVLPPLRPVGSPTEVAPLPALRFASVHSPEADTGVRLAALLHAMTSHHATLMECEDTCSDAHWQLLVADHASVIRSMLHVPQPRPSRAQPASKAASVSPEAITRLGQQLLACGRVGNRIVMYTSDLRRGKHRDRDV